MKGNMKVHEAIIHRRSVRKYKDIPLSEGLIKKTIKAAIWAPSGLNNQPWKFKIVRDKKTKNGLADYTKYSGIIKNAPAAICVFLDKAVSYDRDKDIMAIGACIQNMLLASHALGLVTCWLGEILNRKKEVQRFLGLKAQYELMAVVTIGYAAGKSAKSKRKPVENFILD